MRAALEAFNKYDQSIRDKCVLLIMDVKALFPSMEWEDIKIFVKEVIEKSVLVIDNVDWREVGKYIAVVVTQEEMDHKLPQK